MNVTLPPDPKLNPLVTAGHVAATGLLLAAAMGVLSSRGNLILLGFFAAIAVYHVVARLLHHMNMTVAHSLFVFALDALVLDGQSGG